MWDWIKNLFNNSALGIGYKNLRTGLDSSGAIVDGLINSITQEHMTGSAKEASALEQQNQKDMALFNQGLSEDWYNRHQSASALVKEYNDAGLNPALMFGNSASVGGDNMQQMASGASAEPGNNPISAFDMVNLLMDVSMKKEQIRSIKEDNDFKDESRDIRLLGMKLDNDLKTGNVEFGTLRNFAQNVNNEILSQFGYDKARYEADTAKWEAFATENQALFDKEVQPLVKRSMELANSLTKADISKKTAETGKIYQELENLKEDYNRIKAQVANINANTEKTNKEASYIDMDEFMRYISVSAQMTNATTYAMASTYPMFLDESGKLSKSGKGVMASWTGLEATIQSSINKVWGDSGFYIPSGYHGKMPLNSATTRPASENVKPEAIVAQYKTKHAKPDFDSFMSYATSKGMSRFDATMTYVFQLAL